MIGIDPRRSALAAILLLALGGGASAAEDGGLSAAEGQARALLAGSGPLVPNFYIPGAIAAYRDKCGEAQPRCFLNECDAGFENCREDHLLLFRGEAKFYGPVPTSALARACAGGSDFCAGLSPEQALEKLKSAVSVFRPIDHVPYDEAEIVLTEDRASGSQKWLYRRYLDGTWQSPKEFSSQGPTGLPALSYRQILFLTHQAASYLEYQDPAKGAVSVDPLISFSSNPRLALYFATLGNKTPLLSRFIVISVPRSELDADCGESAPSPGRILDPERCGHSGYDREAEFSGVVYVKPEYVRGNFSVSAEALNWLYQ